MVGLVLHGGEVAGQWGNLVRGRQWGNVGFPGLAWRWLVRVAAPGVGNGDVGIFVMVFFM